MIASEDHDDALWRRIFPLAEAPYRYAIGVRPLSPPRLTLKTKKHAHELDCKQQVERDRRRTPFAALAGSEDAQIELVEAVLKERPELSLDESERPLLHALSLHIQEDLILLREDAHGAIRLIAGALHFPSVWSLSEKLGQEFLEFHAPVRGFADSQVGAKSAKFLSLLQPDRPVWRANWTLQPSDRLDTSPENRDDWIALRQEVRRDNVSELIYLRSEYQKLFRLPISRAIVFSIHTVLTPIREVAACQPEAGILEQTLRTLDPEISRYKGMVTYRDFVADYLRTAASD